MNLTGNSEKLVYYDATGWKWDISSGVRNLMLSSVLTRDKATYAPPWPRLMMSNQTTTLSSVWPCDLQMVIAYPGTSGKHVVMFPSPSWSASLFTVVTGRQIQFYHWAIL
jgi:hypothetical protein